MRRLLSILAAGALILGSSAQSQGGELISASFNVDVLGNVFLFPAGPGVLGNASSNVAATLEAGSAFSGFASTAFVANSTQPVSAIYVYLQNNLVGNFAGNPLDGGALFTGNATIFVGGGPLAVIPLAIGTPGTVLVSKLNAKGNCSFCLTGIGASWTAGTATITNVATTLGGSLVNITVMGINGLTAAGNGTLTLVSPGKVITNLTGAIPLVSTLTLTYAVPEPGAPLLLLAGVAALIAFGRGRASA